MLLPPEVPVKRSLLVSLGVAAGAVVLLVAGLGVAVAMQPDHIIVERSRIIAAAPERVHPHLHDYRSFVQWSPWSGRDPAQTTTFSEPSSGEGAWYTWDGNDDVGAGRMDTTLVQADRIEQDLTFTRPFEAKAKVVYTLSPVGEDRTQVTWTMDQPADLPTKAITLVVDMDAMIGADFDSGLDALKARVEAEPAPVEEAPAEGEAPMEEVPEAEGSAAGGVEGDGSEGEGMGEGE